jgi:alkylated DNA repair dioxygenase AlkB
MTVQLTLLGHQPAAIDRKFRGLTTHQLSNGAWIHYCLGWLERDAEVFEHLVRTTRWQSDRRPMYERVIEVPRLTARYPEQGSGHPILEDIAVALSQRYSETFDQHSAAYYRDGRDSVAPHGDRIGRNTRESVVAIVSLGHARRFLLKPTSGGPSLAFETRFDDLLVMVAPGASVCNFAQSATDEVA